MGVERRGEYWLQEDQGDIVGLRSHWRGLRRAQKSRLRRRKVISSAGPKVSAECCPGLRRALNAGATARKTVNLLGRGSTKCTVGVVLRCPRPWTLYCQTCFYRTADACSREDSGEAIHTCRKQSLRDWATVDLQAGLEYLAFRSPS